MELWIADISPLRTCGIDRTEGFSRVLFDATNIEHPIVTLSEEERRGVRKFRKEDDRLRKAVGILLVKNALKKRFPQVDENDLPLRKNPYGKPYADCSLNGEPSFYFNLSHSGDLVVLATAETEIGIDVEKIEPRSNDEFAVLESEFSEEEKRRVRNANHPNDEFYEIWTIREAFSKAVGIGLSLFETEKKHIHIDYENQTIAYQNARYRFETMEKDKHIISICRRDESGTNLQNEVL